MKKIVAAAGTIAVLCGVLGTPAGAAAPATCPGPNSSETVSFTGTFSEAVEGSHVMVPFDVPEGTTRVRLRLCYDQPDLPTSAQIKHTLDLGVYDARGTDGVHDEDEFRGWGGSSRPEVLITPEQATNGFMPGPIPAGEWAAEIGVAAVAGQAEGDTDGT